MDVDAPAELLGHRSHQMQTEPEAAEPRVADWSPWWNRSRIDSRSSGAMPTPWSWISIRTPSRSPHAATTSTEQLAGTRAA